jgi:hypothetical protein
MDVNGQIAFEGDSYIPQEILKLKERFKIRNVLETGSQYGSTLKWFTENFDLAQGCEPNNEFYEIAKDKGLNVCNQYSLDFLIMSGTSIGCKSNALIYIDSHWHDTPCPLKDELKLIAELKINPVICIHDLKVPDKDFGYDVYDYELCFEEIEPLLPAIYPDGYEYHYNEFADGANRGIIFIYPKQ